MATDQALRDLILASNPVGYYPLDNLANLGRDSSAYAHHGSQSGTFRQAVNSFFGMEIMMTQGVSAPLIVIPDRDEYKGATFTLEFIVIHTENDNKVVMERGSDGSSLWLQTLGSRHGMPVGSFQWIHGSYVNASMSRFSPPAELSHMIFTSVSGVNKIYVNGRLFLDFPAAGGTGTQKQGNLPIHIFSSAGTFPTLAWLAHFAFYNRELTPAERIARANLFTHSYEFKSTPQTCIPCNQEPRSQFQPQDVAWRGTPPLYPGPVNLQQQTQYPLCKGRDYFWIRDGVRNVEQGFIESTVTISGVGVRRRVLCFTQDGELVGETYSRASDGVYRFDLLWLNKRYMLVAQDDPAFGPADYNAVAADYQAPKPYPPGGGVAPAPFPMLAPLKRK